MITSKPLRQLIELTLDTHSMRGPIEKGIIADEILVSTPDEYWAQADIRNIRRAGIMSELTSMMNRPLPQQAIDLIFNSPAVPDKYRKPIAGLPRYICVNGGGRHALHALTLVATRAQWQENTALKGDIETKIRVSKNVSRNMDDLLEWTGKESLAELLEA